MKKVWLFLVLALLAVNSYAKEPMSFTYQDIPYCNIPEAVMIGYVGMSVNMHYRSDYSWALRICGQMFLTRLAFNAAMVIMMMIL